MVCLFPEADVAERSTHAALLFDERGVVKLADFGLSRILEGPHAQAAFFVGVRDATSE